MVNPALNRPPPAFNRLDDHFPPLPPLPLSPATSVAALAPPDPVLLGPLAPGSITLIRASRGVGKSWLALAMARAVAAGDGLLGWRGRPAPVVHVDAAMSQAALGARLRALGPAGSTMTLIGDCPLDLGTVTDQSRFIEALPDGALLVLDGLSLLVPSGRAAAARWQAFCDWLRMLRKDGHAVLLVDHAPRPAVAALADTHIALRPAHDETQVAFDAAIVSRSALPAVDRAFAARLDLSDGTARWTREAVADPALRAVAEAARDGGTVRDMAAVLGLSTATAWRRLAKAKALGLVADAKAGETGETAGAGAAPASASAVAPTAIEDKPRETGETGRPPGLAQVSTSVLRRTLARRLDAHRRGHVSPDRREGPAVLAGIADAALVAECTRRVPPAQAARLLKQFAPLQAAV